MNLALASRIHRTLISVALAFAGVIAVTVSPYIQAQAQEPRCFSHTKGSFQYVGEMWQEYHNQKPIYRYVEAYTDSTFIYLGDSDRDLMLAIPRAGGPVRFWYIKGPFKDQRSLYNGSSDPVGPNCVNPSRTCYGYTHFKATFEDVGPMWQEYYSPATDWTYRFLWISRDSAFEYLHDMTRNLTLALPRASGPAQVQSPGGPWTFNGYEVHVCNPSDLNGQSKFKPPVPSAETKPSAGTSQSNPPVAPGSNPVVPQIQFTCVFQNGGSTAAYFAGKAFDFVDMSGTPTLGKWKDKVVQFAQAPFLNCKQEGGKSGIQGVPVASAKIRVQTVTYYADITGKMITVASGPSVP